MVKGFPSALALGPRDSAATMRFAGVTLEQCRARKHELHSQIIGPGFVATEKDDFRLCHDSPALKFGFQPLELSRAGEWTQRK